MKNLLINNINAIDLVLNNIQKDKLFLEIFNQASNVIAEALKNGGRIYIAGNGGSAADSQHIAAEFISRLSMDRAPLSAEALTTDTSILTAIGNDYGFEYIFSRQLEVKLKKNDVFIGITTSGNSKNILLALEECKRKNVKSILLSGEGGGAASVLADYLLLVPCRRTQTIQEAHILIGHSLCEASEKLLFG